MLVVELINYREEGSLVFAGSDEVIRLRHVLDLDFQDTHIGKVVFNFPEDTLSVNSSWFRCMFGKSFQKLKSKAFKQKYTFTGSEFILECIQNEIDDLEMNFQFRKGEYL